MGHVPGGSGLVSWSGQASVQPSRLGLRTRLDSPLHPHGGGFFPDLERKREVTSGGKGHGCLGDPAFPEFPLVFFLFLGSVPWVGLSGDSPPAPGPDLDPESLLSSAASCGVVDDALPGLGYLCLRSERLHLDTEPLIHAVLPPSELPSRSGPLLPGISLHLPGYGEGKTLASAGWDRRPRPVGAVVRVELLVPQKGTGRSEPTTGTAALEERPPGAEVAEEAAPNTVRSTRRS